MEAQKPALNDVESMPEVDWLPNTEIVHLFGTEERMFLEIDSGDLDDDVLYASDGQQVDVLEYDDRAYFRDGGTTVWDISEGYELEVLVNPSDSKVQRGERPRAYTADPTDGRGVGVWWMMRNTIPEQDDVLGEEMYPYISDGKNVF